MSKQSLCSHRLEGRGGGGSGHPLGAVRASTALSTVINPQPCDPPAPVSETEASPRPFPPSLTQLTLERIQELLRWLSRLRF